LAWILYPLHQLLAICL